MNRHTHVALPDSFLYVSLHGGGGNRYAFPNETAACRFAVGNRNPNDPSVVFDSNGDVLHLYPRKMSCAN